MIRTQIELTEEQARRLRTIAQRDGVALAEVILRAVEKSVAAEEVDL